MREAAHPIFITLLLYCSLGALDAGARNIPAASCSRADVTTAYNSASGGDTIIIPAGDCQTTNKWSSSLDITKKVTLQGSGAGNTLMGISTSTPIFEIESDSVVITGITFNCNYQNTSTTGIIFIGEYSTCPTASYKDWRIDHNTFDNCADGIRDVSAEFALRPPVLYHSQSFILLKRNSHTNQHFPILRIMAYSNPAEQFISQSNFSTNAYSSQME